MPKRPTPRVPTKRATERLESAHRLGASAFAGAALGEGLERLPDLLDAERRLHELIRLAVREARTLGHSWQEIGDVLGVTRQAAQKRFGGS